MERAIVNLNGAFSPLLPTNSHTRLYIWQAPAEQLGMQTRMWRTKPSELAELVVMS